MKIPMKLKQGDEIRIIAPSRSLKILSEDGIQLAKERLEQLGFKVTFGKHVEVCDRQNSSSVVQRIEDLHDAFADKNIRKYYVALAILRLSQMLSQQKYMPHLKNSVLFIEDDGLTSPETFARDLTSLLQASEGIKGLLIGRFQKVSKVTEEQLHFILDKHPQLKNIPVLYDMDFGHTQPIMTLPIGGTVSIDTKDLNLKLSKF